MISWSSIWAFLILFPLAIIAFLSFKNRNKSYSTLRFSGVKGISKLGVGLRAKFIHLPLYLKVIALSLAIIALARPQRADEKIHRNVEGVDIMIALDVSDSMLIEDMKPENRLESSKKTIHDFISRRISDRIGLVVFSGESYTRVPLTLDYKILYDSLAGVKTSRNIKMGTAIGVALANSVARIKESTAKSRVIILMTDGENNSGTIDPLTALKIAKGYGLRIYTIGMGKDGQAQLPIITRDSHGNERKRYQPIHSKINETLLRRLADETGGKFFRAITTNTLEAVFSEINTLEKSEIEISKYTKYAELFPVFLTWALFIYIIGFILAHLVLRRVP